jgi:hypothetical protein
MSDKSLAFSVETFRRHLLERVEVPPDMVTKALAKIDQKMDAKITKFFTFRGRVVSTVDVEDHSTQLSAAHETLGIAGLASREKEVVEKSPTVILEIDPVTGTMRLVVGTPSQAEITPPTRETIDVECSPVEQPTLEGIKTEDFTIVEEPPELIPNAHPRLRRVPDKVWKILSDEIVE